MQFGPATSDLLPLDFHIDPNSPRATLIELDNFTIDVDDLKLTEMSLTSIPHPNMPKNPLNVARAYTAMQRNKDLDLNMYQRAFLSDRDRNIFPVMFLGLAVYVSQVVLFLIVWIYAISEKEDVESIIETPYTSNTVPIVVVIVISIRLFIYDAWQSVLGSLKFSNPLSCYNRKFALDLLVNLSIGIGLVGSNAYFLLLSKSPFDAVINSLALGFIYHIDDTVKPRWGKDRIADENANFMYRHVTKPLLGGEISISKVGSGPVDSNGSKVYVRVSKANFDGNVPVDKFYVDVFFRSDRNGVSDAPTRYTVSGTRLAGFHQVVNQFHCIGILGQQREKYRADDWTTISTAWREFRSFSKKIL